MKISFKNTSEIKIFPVIKKKKVERIHHQQKYTIGNVFIKKIIRQDRYDAGWKYGFT